MGKENTHGTLDGTVKAGAMSFARFSTDDFDGQITGYVGEGAFTDDPLNTFGGAGVVEIPKMQELLRFICENGFRAPCGGELLGGCGLGAGGGQQVPGVDDASARVRLAG